MECSESRLNEKNLGEEEDLKGKRSSRCQAMTGKLLGYQLRSHSFFRTLVVAKLN